MAARATLRSAAANARIVSIAIARSVGSSTRSPVPLAAITARAVVSVPAIAVSRAGRSSKKDDRPCGGCPREAENRLAVGALDPREARRREAETEPDVDPSLERDRSDGHEVRNSDCTRDRDELVVAERDQCAA